MAISQVIWSLDDKKQLQTAELLNEKELEDLLAEHIEILPRLESILICFAWTGTGI